MKTRKPVVGIIMGSDSDLPPMQDAAKILDAFDVPYEMKVVSAHRTPRVMAQYGSSAHRRGIKVIIAGAGGAAHLPGMTASHSPLPVIGVPVRTTSLDGLDALLSIAQMPSGVPVAAVAIGNGTNAGLLAVEILATADAVLLRKLLAYKKRLARDSMAKNRRLRR
jgi:5-(carboxyamino)imidazole ribonucleotide mutase